MVSGTEGSFSTRKGNMVKLRDVLSAACEKTLAIIEEKSPGLEDKETVARQVGIGAVVWSSLYNGRIKDVVFDWDAILNFDGETGPYAQYTHARACSVLRKAEYGPAASIDYSVLTGRGIRRGYREYFRVSGRGAGSDGEKRRRISFPAAVIAIASAFNKFYYEQRIMADDEAVRAARLALTDATRSVIAIGLGLLGLSAPERM